MNLIDLAKEASKKAYTPYSHFNVGAALLTKTNKVYLGCNVENGNFVSGCCAEKTAFVKAISEGEKEFQAIAIYGGKDDVHDYCLPCGSCRQVINEFCDKDFRIYVTNDKEVKCYTLDELLPHSFKLEDK